MILTLLMAALLSMPNDKRELTVPVVQVDHKSEWIEELAKCENENHVPRILDTNGKYSYGDLMFQMNTWLSYGKQFGATGDNIGSSTLQRVVARSMLDDGGWRHWFACAIKTKKILGSYE